MKKLKMQIVGLVATVVILTFLGVYLFEKNIEEPEEIFAIPVSSDELFISSEEGYNSIKIYKQENLLVINALSEAAFFDGAQFTVRIDGEITPDDIEIIWMTIDGSTEYVEGNDRIIAEIKISNNDELICDTKINFAKKAFDAIEDVLDRSAITMKIFLKIILCIMGSLIALIVVFWFYISYTINYKKTTCDISVSPDGKYELMLQAVGEPDWPFGSASGRLVLKEGNDKISQTNFELYNDGGSIHSSCWEVTWYEDYVEVILSGDEQFDEQITLYFDGTKDIRQLTDTEENYITGT